MSNIPKATCTTTKATLSTNRHFTKPVKTLPLHPQASNARIKEHLKKGDIEREREKEGVDIYKDNKDLDTSFKLFSLSSIIING